jgi:hypothetical protein
MATTATMKKLAEDYGYQLAFFKSNAELYRVFQKAVDGGWDGERFKAAVLQTQWYKKTSETARAAQQLKYTDPATYNSRVAQQRAALGAMAYQIGAPIPGATMQRLAEQAVQYGWSSDQMRQQVGRYTKVGPDMHGGAAQTAQAIKQTAYRNGVNVTDSFVNDWVRRVALGTANIEDAQQQIRSHYGKTIAPGFAKELDSGMDLADIASPYMQTMAKTLELNPASIDLFDPTIRKALAGAPGPDGKATPAAVPLWQFETSLRKDPRWMQTNNARDSVDQATRSLSQMFGLGV